MSAAFGRTLSELMDLSIFVELCRDGLRAGTTAVDLLETLRDARLVLKKPDPFPNEDAFVSAKNRAQEMENLAKREVPADFPYLHGLATMRIWGILETAVDDWIAERLSDPQQWASYPLLCEMKGPLIEFAASPKERQAEYLIDELKRLTRSKLRPGIGRFEATLESVGLGGGVDEKVRRVILELSEVRNLIAHRGWEADKLFVEKCPWLELSVGDRLAITHERFQAYHASAMWYLFEIGLRANTTGNFLDEASAERTVRLRDEYLTHVGLAQFRAATPDQSSGATASG